MTTKALGAFEKSETTHKKHSSFSHQTWILSIFVARASNFDFCLLQSSKTHSEAHRTSHLMWTEGVFLGAKWPGREADHSPPFSAEVMNYWSYTSTSPYAFMSRRGTSLVSILQPTACNNLLPAVRDKKEQEWKSYHMRELTYFFKQLLSKFAFFCVFLMLIHFRLTVWSPVTTTYMHHLL